MSLQCEKGDIFYACRVGNIERVKHLIELRDIDVNTYDCWDSTPLYYACLCGHQNVVEYLLQKGARCEANTFDGERCLYGALTDRIRNLLKSYKVLYAFSRNSYVEFLNRLRDSKSADVIFVVHGREFRAHRCILMVRSNYFAERFSNRWKNRSKIFLNNPLVNADAFQALLQYVYCAQVEISISLMDDFERLIKQCNLGRAFRRLQVKRTEIESFLASKPGILVNILHMDADVEELRECFSNLSNAAIPEELTTSANREMPFREAQPEPVFCDVCFLVEDSKFLCHQSFFCGRSRYFKALIENQLCGEELIIKGEDNCNCSAFNTIPIVRIRALDAESFRQIVFYVYEDSTYFDEDVTSQYLLQLIDKAEMYLLPGLKRQCSSRLEEILEMDNIFYCLQAARLFVLHRLEQACYRFMAKRIESVVGMTDFVNLVQNDADAVQSREETDTIDVIDQVRYHILNLNICSNEQQVKLECLHNLLLEMNLEC